MKKKQQSRAGEMARDIARRLNLATDSRGLPREYASLSDADIAAVAAAVASEVTDLAADVAALLPHAVGRDFWLSRSILWVEWGQGALRAARRRAIAPTTTVVEVRFCLPKLRAEWDSARSSAGLPPLTDSQWEAIQAL